MTAVAFGFASNPANTLVEALLLGGVVESFVVATNFNVAGTAFLGFSGIVFDQIRVTVGGDTQGIAQPTTPSWVVRGPVPSQVLPFFVQRGSMVIGIPNRGRRVMSGHG